MLGEDETLNASLRVLMAAQRGEVTEYHVYKRLASRCSDPANRDILERIAADELAHAEALEKITKKKPTPIWRKVFWYLWLARILGLTFAIKLMERGERRAEARYRALGTSRFPELAQLISDEHRHEEELIGLIDEERLRYISSIVLGLNDALVEFTGALAGMTFALPNVRLVGTAGLVTGIAAALSMGASEYLSARLEAADPSEKPRSPLKAAFYTSAAYIIAVAALVSPYLVFTEPYICLLSMVGSVAVLIFLFTYYVSVARGQALWSRFGEMLALSMGVAGVSFGVGALVRHFLGVEV